MSQPSTAVLSPQAGVAKALAASASFDVIVAASRAAHGQELRDGDRRSLELARTLLDRLAAQDAPVAALPASQQLASGETLAALRSAVHMSDEHREAVSALAIAVGRALADEQDGEVRRGLAAVRDIFALAVKVGNQQDAKERSAGADWEIWEQPTTSPL